MSSTPDIGSLIAQRAASEARKLSLVIQAVGWTTIEFAYVNVDDGMILAMLMVQNRGLLNVESIIREDGMTAWVVYRKNVTMFPVSLIDPDGKALREKLNRGGFTLVAEDHFILPGAKAIFLRA